MPTFELSRRSAARAAMVAGPAALLAACAPSSSSGGGASTPAEATAAGAPGDDSGTNPRVVVHVSNSPDDVGRAIGSAGRIAKAIDGAKVHVIVNSAAAKGLAKPGDPFELPQNVTLSACEVAMATHGITKNELRGGVTTVPSGVVALSEAQLDGAAYIRI